MWAVDQQQAVLAVLTFKWTESKMEEAIVAYQLCCPILNLLYQSKTVYYGLQKVMRDKLIGTNTSVE